MSSLKVVSNNIAPVDGWESALKADKNGNTRGSLFNVIHILEHDEQTRGRVRFNDVTRTIDVSEGPFAGGTETLHTEAAAWFEQQHNMAIGSAMAGEALLAVGCRHRYDPLRDYLRGLRWDGKKRIDNLLLDVGAIAVGDDGKDRSDHFRRISRRWFVAAVNRALDPGCQMDVVLVLKGKQGIKKTSLFRVLGGPFFCDTELDLRDKDAKLLAGGNWIIELAELTSLRRTGSSKGANGFITSRTDKFRPPFGRCVQSFPRRCIFVGTTNDDQFLSDPSGHRRYWIVPLSAKKIDIKAIEPERDQLWAEAVAAFDAGEVGFLEGEEAQEAEEIAEEHASELPFVEKIRTWWNGLEVKEVLPIKGAPNQIARASRLTCALVAERVLRVSEQDLDDETRKQIGAALRGLGFVQKREGRKAGLGRYYAATEAMITHGLG